MSSEGYTFHRVSTERLKDIKYLYAKCFGEDVSMEFLIKKYDTNEFGTANIGFIAYHNNENPAAYYGVFPCKAVVDGKTCLCAQSGDTMTHPDHRGKGLFVSLALDSYRLARESNIKFVFGFPNENSYPGFVKKLSWVHKGNLNVYRLRVLTFPWAYISGRLKFLAVLYNAYAGFILRNKLSKRTFFDNPLVDSKNSGLLRDEDFFKYKNYLKKEIIEIGGKCVYVKLAGTLRVGDVEKCDEETFYRIIKKLKRIAWWLGCYALVFQYSPGVEYDRFLAKKFPADCLEGTPIGWVDFESGLELDTLKFAQADIDTY